MHKSLLQHEEALLKPTAHSDPISAEIDKIAEEAKKRIREAFGFVSDDDMELPLRQSKKKSEDVTRLD